MSRLSPIVKNKSVIISATVTILGWLYKALDAAGNIEFLLLKLHVNEDVARFLGSDRAIDFFIAVSMIALVVAVLYQLNRLTQPATQPPTDKLPVADPQLHDDSERKIRHLESQVGRLQRNDQTQGIQISSRDGQIQQLEAKIQELKWLTDLAQAQAQSIQSWVYVDCSLHQHELLRDTPYVTFQFTAENRSVYDISLGSFEGYIHFADVLLAAEPRVLTNTADHIRPGEAKHCYLRQPLEKQEVADILNRRSRFLFHDLHCKITAQQGEVRAQDWCVRDSVDNNGLLTAYPKLEIDVSNVTCTFIVNFNTWNIGPVDGIFTMHVGLTNKRSIPVSIDTFHLLVSIKGETYTAAAETGDTWEKYYINKEGELVREGLRLDNLVSKAPFRVGQSQIGGDLQFILKGVGAAMLNRVSYELIVTDIFGEKHLHNGTANVPEGQVSD